MSWNGLTPSPFPPPKGTYSTPEVAEACGRVPRTLRYWVTRGLIPNLQPTSTGYRLVWTPEQRDRALRIAQGAL